MIRISYTIVDVCKEGDVNCYVTILLRNHECVFQADMTRNQEMAWQKSTGIFWNLERLGWPRRRWALVDHQRCKWQVTLACWDGKAFNTPSANNLPHFQILQSNNCVKNDIAIECASYFAYRYEVEGIVRNIKYEFRG